MSRTPTFRGLRASSPASSHAMRGNRKHNTQPEVLLHRALSRIGLRFQRHVRDLPGEPDVAFIKAKVAVFCDGDFWHGRNWRSLKMKLAHRANASYWMAKIAANRRRDALNSAALRRRGWTVVRFWETDIMRDPGTAVLKIKNLLAAIRGHGGG